MAAPFYLSLGCFLSHYHRARHTSLHIPKGPCIYVTHHGFGYLSLDIYVACYRIGWQNAFEQNKQANIVRTAVATSRLEKALPFLSYLKKQVHAINPDHRSLLQALTQGEQILLSPGGTREARPNTAEPYQLKWQGRYGFIRLALLTGVPVVPLAVVGGQRAYPGWQLKKWSLWSPIALPAQLHIHTAPPIEFTANPAQAADLATVKKYHTQVWQTTQELYQQVIREAYGKH